ncbi:hypothetical protein BDP81DRAFT_161365 [Colletotrichum phormii]|uniref:Uncharacterized protein n=1 Tax=Colletotrichum phormii TaxID=359342 RepID=A0AAJ0EKS4_9PEZI|nr:uncharacterized protein BDP81DRAFT_161365 [Colletotrichum phormii]KAK1640316.1 hypothetical protein BDP81DRAFT_161365 [Colletotrichum phormii]
MSHPPTYSLHEALGEEPLCHCRRLVRGRRTRSSRCGLISPPIESSLSSPHRCFSVSPGHAIDVLTVCCYWAMSPAATMARLGWCSSLRPYSPSPLTHTFAALRNPSLSLSLSYTITHTRHTSHQLSPAPGIHTASLQLCNRVFPFRPYSTSGRWLDRLLLISRRHNLHA